MIATEEDLLKTPRDGNIYELVDGEIRRNPGGARHSTVSLSLATDLARFVRARCLGHVFGPDTGHRLPSGNVRCPDVSFVTAGRWVSDQLGDDFVNVAPDLAVEVISPKDRPFYVLDRIGEYLEAGVRLVWVIDPANSRAVAYRSLIDVRSVGLEDYLEGGDVLPGFRCRLREIL